METLINKNQFHTIPVAKFGWDGMEEEGLSGYDLTEMVGGLNGFSSPAFEKSVADQICALTLDYPQPTTYNPESDVYEQPEERGSSAMITVGVLPAMYETVDGSKKLYSFQESGWTWMKDE